MPDLVPLALCHLAELQETPNRLAEAILAQAKAELGGAPLLEGELTPLYSVPGWYAYRADDRVHGDGGALEQTVLFMRSDLVERTFGCLPEGRCWAPRIIQES